MVLVASSRLAQNVFVSDFGSNIYEFSSSGGQGKVSQCAWLK